MKQMLEKKNLIKENILIDTHCHMNLMLKKNFDVALTSQELKNYTNIVEQAQANNVDYIINVGTSLIESKNCLKLAQQSKSIFAAVGIHPNDLSDNLVQDLQEIKELILKDKKNDKKIVAIGECGIDKHYPDYNLTRQKEAFARQIELALEQNLAVIIHTRDAGPETLEVLQNYKDTNLKAVVHCFSQDLDFAQKVISWGLYLGIGGTITYPKNNTLRNVIQSVGLSNIILETDAPYLAPQAFRGKPNHPKYIKNIAEFIAEILDITLEDVANHTTNNAFKLFNLSA